MDSKEQKTGAVERSNSLSISMRDAVVLPKGSGSFFFHGLYRHQLEASNSLSYGLLGCLRLTILVYAVIVLLLNLIGEPKAMQYMATYTHFIIVIYMFSASIYSLRAWWRQREARKEREYLNEDDANDSDKEASADLSEKASLVPKPSGVPPLDIKKAQLVSDGAISFRGVIKEADSKRTLGTDLGFWGKLTYVLFQLGFSWSLVVMIMYWSVENPNPNDNKILAAHVHGATFVWMFIDLFFNQIEFVHSHLIFLAVTFVLYFTFNGIYSLSVAPIYDVLSWKSATTFPVLLAFIVGFVIAFYFGYVLTRLRDRCTQRHYVFVPVGSKAAPELDDDDDEPCPTPAFFEVNSQHGGGLMKRSARSKNWRKRLALIEGPFLYYYLNKQDYNPRAVLSLVGANAKLEPEVSRETGQSCFSVTCPKAWNIELHEKYYGRTYYFSCESSDEARVWVAEIEKSAASQPDPAKLA